MLKINNNKYKKPPQSKLSNFRFQVFRIAEKNIFRKRKNVRNFRRKATRQTKTKPNEIVDQFRFYFLCSLHNTTLRQTCNKRHAAACGKCRRSQRQKYFQFRDSLDSLAAPRRNYKKSNIKKEARRKKNLKLQLTAVQSVGV